MATQSIFVGAMPLRPSIGRWIGAVVPLDYSRPKVLTMAWVKPELAAIGVSIRKDESGDYRVNFRGFPEDTAYYCPDLDDAYDTAVAMYRRQNGLDGCEHATSANGVCLECFATMREVN
jgi:hypothetical protein